MKFKDKAGLVQFVKNQTNFCIQDDKDNFLNHNKKVLYAEINRENKGAVLGLLNKYGIRYESHVKDCYFVYVN